MTAEIENVKTEIADDETGLEQAIEALSELRTSLGSLTPAQCVTAAKVADLAIGTATMIVLSAKRDLGQCLAQLGPNARAQLADQLGLSPRELTEVLTLAEIGDDDFKTSQGRFRAKRRNRIRKSYEALDRYNEALDRYNAKARAVAA